MTHQHQFRPGVVLGNASNQRDAIPEDEVMHAGWIVAGFAMARQIDTQYWYVFGQQRTQTIEGARIVLPTVQRQYGLLVSRTPPFTCNHTNTTLECNSRFEKKKYILAMTKHNPNQVRP